MSSNSDLIKKGETAIGEAAKAFVERLPENIASVGGAAAGYYSGQGIAWAIGATTIGSGALYPIVLPILTFGGLAAGAVYSYKFARKTLKETKEKEE